MSSIRPPAHEMEAWQLRLDARFPRVPMLRPDQVADGLGCDPKTVANLFVRDGRSEKPWIMGIEFNGRGTGVNMSRRIPRENAIIFWAASANYRPDDFLALLMDVIDGLHPKERLLVQQRISELQRRG